MKGESFLIRVGVGSPFWLSCRRPSLAGDALVYTCTPKTSAHAPELGGKATPRQSSSKYHGRSFAQQKRFRMTEPRGRSVIHVESPSYTSRSQSPTTFDVGLRRGQGFSFCDALPFSVEGFHGMQAGSAARRFVSKHHTHGAGDEQGKDHGHPGDVQVYEILNENGS